MCSRQDFYFDSTQSALIFPVVRCRHLTVLSNTDRSLSNNKLTITVKNVYKKYYNDCFYIIIIL